MLTDLKSIKIWVERSLPPDVVAAMREAGIALTLTPGEGVRIGDELAEKELLEEMVSYRKDVTGVDNTVFISPKGQVRPGPRVKLAINPPDSLDPSTETASIAIEGGNVVAGQVPAKLHKQVQRFIELNRDVLLDYWNYRIDTKQLQQRLKPIE
jgi:hypothetical protein